ncbi:EpsG family protein [Synechococcus sp. AH-551-G15]|nr:EpsG family protein [Synechococcus sp. AH-551-G15]
MIPYWLLLLLPIWACVQGPRRPWPAWQAWLIGITLTLFIGLRHEVGGDWFSYIPYLTRAEGIHLAEVIAWGDPGYNILNFLFADNSIGIYGVNLVSGAIFSAGLVLFCRAQPRPWLALCLAIPYLVIVVAMGYSRQGVALGLIMPGMLALERGRLWPFLLAMAAAATFHSTALVMLAFVVPAVRGRSLIMRALRLLLLLIVGATLVQTFLVAHVEMMVAGYIEVEYKSEGAAIRVAMNLLPGLLLLLWPKRFDFTDQQLRLWRAMAFTALGCALALVLLPDNSTAVDRIALYVIPLQLVVGCRLPGTKLFGLKQAQLLLAVLGFCVAVEFVWLNFATHASGWLPYASVLGL